MSISSPLPLLSLRFSRHSTVSLSRFSAPLTRRLAASAKPRDRLGLGFSIRASEQIHTQIDVREDYAEPNGGGFSANSRVSHPWPEWSKLVLSLRSGGYFDRSMAVVSPEDDDAFSAFEDLPAEFVRAANACLCFARDRPDLLRYLTPFDSILKLGYVKVRNFDDFYIALTLVNRLCVEFWWFWVVRFRKRTLKLSWRMDQRSCSRMVWIRLGG